jgi:hypothetical protein
MKALATALFALLCACVMAHAADAPPILDISIPDGARLIQHWNANPVGQMWNDPTLAPIRARLDAAKPEMTQELGCDPLAALAALKSFRLVVSGVGDGGGGNEFTGLLSLVRFLVQADLGDQAATVFAAIKVKGTGSPATVADATEAISFDATTGIVLARFGTTLVFGPAKGLKPQPIAPSDHDATIAFDGAALTKAVQQRPIDDAKLRKTIDLTLVMLKRLLVPMRQEIDVIEAGFRSHATAETTLPWLTPVDLALFGRLPANTQDCVGVGFDGKALWADLRGPLFELVALNAGSPPAEVEKEADGLLAQIGIIATWTQLVEGLRGTVLFATTPGSPMQAYTLAIPRSPALDQALGVGMKLLSADLPAEGQGAMVPVPNLPVAVMLVRDRTHWVITTDLALSSSWTANADGGWLGSPLGKLAIDKAGKGVCLVGARDEAANLRFLMGYAGMALGVAPGLEAKEKQAIVQGLNLLAKRTGLGFAVLRQDGGRLVGDDQGLISSSGASLPVIAIIAAIAIPNLMQSRIAASEAAAAVSLRAGVFPAQVQFQSGSYVDEGGPGRTWPNDIGDYASELRWLAGATGGNGKRGPKEALSLLGPEWNAEVPEIGGYRYKCFAKYETGFVVYAWPVSRDRGRRCFALTATGQVYARPGTDEPGEFDLGGGKETPEYIAEPQPPWVPYQR